jgi:hypothetical protein
VDEHRDEEAAEEGPERVGDVVVRFAEHAHENAEPEGDHQHPDPVGRPAVPPDQTREDEGAADEEDECRRARRMLLVVTGRRESDRECSGEDRRRCEREPGTPRQPHATRRAAIAAPDRSPFGTKPRAPQTSMHGP